MTRKAAKKATKKKAKRSLLTRRELAAVLGRHPMSIVKWQDEGMPIAERGSRGRASYYREVDVRAWLQLREEAAKQPGAVNAVGARARAFRAQAALAEQTLLIRSRDLLLREEVEKEWSHEVSAVRTKLMSWSATLADKIYRAATVGGLGAVEEVLAAAVKDVLSELAKPEVKPE